MSLKWISLAILLVQNAMTPLVSRAATTSAAASERYSLPAAVLLAEMLKFLMSLVLILQEEGWSMSKFNAVINSEIINKPRDTFKLLVPAGLYFLQNVVLQLSASNLPAALFQVTYQGKTLVVAFFAVVLLQKQLTRQRWLAIAIMGSGLAIVQLAGSKESTQDDMANGDEQSIPTGLLFALLGCCTSGFAGVYFEKLMKTKNSSGKKPSMWVRNVQLAGFSIILGIFSILFTPHTTSNDEFSLTRGFTPAVYMMVMNSAIGGLCVAFVIKHADNILKGFACAVATILSAIMAVPLFGFDLNIQFFVGMLVVLASVLMYGGAYKLPGVWWTEEPALCGGFRQTASDDKKPNASVSGKTIAI